MEKSETGHREAYLLSDRDVVDFTRARVEAWDFKRRSAEESLSFAFHVTHWLADTFEDGLLLYEGEIPGERVPAPLRLLLRREHLGEEIFTGDNKIVLHKEPQFEYVKPYIPNFEEFRGMGGDYTAVLNRIMSDQNVLAGIRMPRFIYTNRVRVEYQPGFYHGWGLDFFVEEDSISIAAWGKSGKTFKPTQFIQEYGANLKLMAALVSDLAVLGAGDLKSRNRPCVPLSWTDEFDRRLEGRSKIIPKVAHVPEGIEELMLRLLLEKGWRPQLET